LRSAGDQGGIEYRGGETSLRYERPSATLFCCAVGACAVSEGPERNPDARNAKTRAAEQRRRLSRTLRREEAEQCESGWFIRSGELLGSYGLMENDVIKALE